MKYIELREKLVGAAMMDEPALNVEQHNSIMRPVLIKSSWATSCFIMFWNT